MDDKIKRMRDMCEQLYELQQATPSSFVQSLNAQRIADDIIHKLCLLQKVVDDQSPRSSRSTRSSSSGSSYDRHASLQDTTNRCSRSSITHCISGVILEDMDDTELEAAAKEAFDGGNSARCTRIVEYILKKSNAISRELFLIGHNAYKANVDDSIGTKEIKKFLGYWRTYLDNVSIKDCTFDDQLEMTDCRSECMWKCLMLATSDAERLATVSKVMEAQMSGYESTAVDFRPFHPKCLRRLHKMCSIIEKYFDEFPGVDTSPPCIEEALEIIRLGVHRAKVDAKEYARETGINPENCSDDVCFIEGTELIKEIDVVLYKYLECDLTHSDSESDCFISSEECTPTSPELQFNADKNSLTGLCDSTPLKGALLDNIFNNTNAIQNAAFITHL